MPALARDRSDQVKDGARDYNHGCDSMQTQIIGSQPDTRAQSVSRPDTVAAIFAALLGAFVIWAVGFSHIEIVHNAAHDTRHSTGFPCH
jgi:cobalt transporter subunit CbtB